MNLPDPFTIVMTAFGTIATIVAAWLAWREQKRPSTSSDVMRLNDQVSVYLSRASTVAAFSDLVDDAPANSVVFGQCRSCVDYPDTFYQSILDAAARNVYFQFIVSPNPDGYEFARRVGGISTMQIRFKASSYARILGVNMQEVITVVSSPNGYVSVHFKDKSAARLQHVAFLKEWQAATPTPDRSSATQSK